jgi:hypothetical protein
VWLSDGCILSEAKSENKLHKIFSLLFACTKYKKKNQNRADAKSYIKLISGVRGSVSRTVVNAADKSLSDSDIPVGIHQYYKWHAKYSTILLTIVQNRILNHFGTILRFLKSNMEI